MPLRIVAVLIASPVAALSLCRGAPVRAMCMPTPSIRMAATELTFESQCKHFAPTSDLPSIRTQMAKIETDLDEAVTGQDFTAAAMLRDDLTELRSKDPALLASEIRERLESLVHKGGYHEASDLRDQLLVLRRFLPQYQLAGLWKGNYPNHGEALVKIHYEGDTLVATKLTGDEHVPAGKITFRADISTPYAEPDGSKQVTEEEMAGVRVEVVSVGSDGTSQHRSVDRFLGAGRIAARSFQHDHYVPGQLFLMDKDVIGFLWLKLGTFVVFNRIADDAPQQLDDYTFEAA